MHQEGKRVTPAFPKLGHLALLPCLPILGLFGCSDPDHPGLDSVENHPDGYWQDTRFPQGTGILDGPARQELERIANIGYADGFEPAQLETGVVQFVSDLAQPGWNLYCSGHGPEARLIDMKGDLQHKWSLPFDQVPSKRTPDLRTQLTWRKVHLLPGGDLLACYEGLGLVRINAQSEKQWYWDGAAHHDFEVVGDTIYTLAREAKYLSYLRSPSGVVEDYVCILDLETGQELRRISIYQAFFESKWRSTFMQKAVDGGDVLHNNSLERIPKALADRIPGASVNDWLLVFRDMNGLAILSEQTGKVVWYQEGPWQGPHSASGLSSGNILLFDNMGHGGFTRLVEWDPLEQAVVWQYNGDPAESFVSIFSGNVVELDGGNLLASVSCGGYALELTRSGQIVWEFQSPHRAGFRRELVAVLFDVQRLPTGQGPLNHLDWLNRGN